MDELNKLVEDEIKSGIEAMGTLTPGTPEYTAASEAISKLFKARAEEQKIELQHQEELDRQAIEDRQHGDELVFKQSAEERAQIELKRNKVQAITSIATDILKNVALPIVFFVVGLGFEKTGMITSYFNKQTLSGLFKKK